ncbi:uncharacterized protein DS421_2g59130 [Arachis hypogaea]|nr:uncharacterized protein DS421_2g59130 [Arachis hypogaea]
MAPIQFQECPSPFVTPLVIEIAHVILDYGMQSSKKANDGGEQSPAVRLFLVWKRTTLIKIFVDKPAVVRRILATTMELVGDQAITATAENLKEKLVL